MFLQLVLSFIILFFDTAHANFCDRLIVQNVNNFNNSELHCKDGTAHEVCNSNMLKWLQHDCSRNVFASIADHCEKLLPKRIQIEQLTNTINNRPLQLFNITCPKYNNDLNFILLSKKSFATENIHRAQLQSIQELNHLNQITNQKINCDQEGHSSFQIKQCKKQQKQCLANPQQINQKINFYQQQAIQYIEISKAISNIDNEIKQIKANLKSWKKTEQQVLINDLNKQKNILLDLKTSFSLRYPWLEGETFKSQLSGRKPTSVKDAMLAQWKKQSEELRNFQTELSNAELCISSEQRKCDFNQINSLLYEINDHLSFPLNRKNQNMDQYMENRILSESNDMYQCLLESTNIRDDSGNRIKSALKDLTISAVAGLATGGVATMGRLAILGTKNLKIAKIAPAIVTTVAIATNIGTSSYIAYQACFQKGTQKSNQDTNNCQIQFQFESEKLERNCFLSQVTIDAVTAGVFHQLGQRLPQFFDHLKSNQSKSNHSPAEANTNSPNSVFSKTITNQTEVEQQLSELAKTTKSLRQKNKQTKLITDSDRQSLVKTNTSATPLKSKSIPSHSIHYQKAKSEWSNVNQPLPDHVPYYSLGMTTKLQQFSKEMELKLNRPVNTHAETSQIPLTSDSLRQQKMFHVNSLQSGSLGAALYHIEHSPGAKPILFNLDDISFENYKLYLKNKSPSSSNFTNQEIQTLTSDKNYFNHVRWFKNGKELNFEELYQLFHEFNPQLFHRD